MENDHCTLDGIMPVYHRLALDGKGDEIGTGLTAQRASDSDPGIRYSTSEF
jgi:hypothetical protein